MLGSIASFGGYRLLPGPAAYTRQPGDEAALPKLPLQPSAAQPTAFAVALAPPAMSALIAAQEHRRSRPARASASARLVARLDRAVYRLGRSSAESAAEDLAPTAACRSRVAVAPLCRMPVDLQA
jgi:hypothetical protein